jgi:hypothetical protein
MRHGRSAGPTVAPGQYGSSSSRARSLGPVERSMLFHLLGPRFPVGPLAPCSNTRPRAARASRGQRSAIHSTLALKAAEMAETRRRATRLSDWPSRGKGRRRAIVNAILRPQRTRVLRHPSAPIDGDAWTSVAVEDRLWEQRRHNEVRRVDHIGYAKIDGNAADDISLLPAKPSLLQQGHHVERRVAAG